VVAKGPGLTSVRYVGGNWKYLDVTGVPIYYAADPLTGEDLANISIEGRGTVDGQIEYEHRPDNIQDFYIKDNKDLMLALGKSIMRSFPKAYPDRKVFPHLILLVRCKDVLVTGIDLRRSPSWTFRPYQCERLVIDGIHIFSSLEDGVWEDGIDPDGCKDVVITNSVIETGDDALVFYWSGHGAFDREGHFLHLPKGGNLYRSTLLGAMKKKQPAMAAVPPARPSMLSSRFMQFTIPANHTTVRA